jgi:hypothetical protein
MGYTKIVQYGDTTEIYEYEQNYRKPKRHHQSEYSKKRLRQIREFKKSRGISTRRQASVSLSKKKSFTVFVIITILKLKRLRSSL